MMGPSLTLSWIKSWAWAKLRMSMDQRVAMTTSRTLQHRRVTKRPMGAMRSPSKRRNLWGLYGRVCVRWKGQGSRSAKYLLPNCALDTDTDTDNQRQILDVEGWLTEMPYMLQRSQGASQTQLPHMKGKFTPSYFQGMVWYMHNDNKHPLRWMDLIYATSWAHDGKDENTISSFIEAQKNGILR